MSEAQEKLSETKPDEPATRAENSKAEKPRTAQAVGEVEAAKKETTPSKKQAKKPKPETATTPSSSQPNAPKSTTTPKHSGNFIAFAGLIIACGALGASYLAWQELSKQLQQTAQTAQSSSSTASSAQNTTQTLQQQMNEFDTQVGNELNRLKQHALDVDKTLTAINDRMTEKSPNDWLVAEARHLINIASHQAQLNHNVAATIAALETANRRLRDTGDPSLIKVREAVTADIVTLKGITRIDATGIALTLAQLEESIETLPLLHEHAQAPTTEPASEGIEVDGVQSFFEKVWSDIKSLVSIRQNEDEFNAALLPPDQRFFLRQNLRLKLETARLALLQQDTQTFRGSIKTAHQWLSQYFDTKAAASDHLLAKLAEYEKLELRPELPNLSNTLRVLESWQQQQRKLPSGSLTGEQTS